MNSQEQINELINRMEIRLTQVYKSPNFYYGKPLYEITEIKQWIKKLEKINNGTHSKRLQGLPI